MVYASTDSEHTVLASTDSEHTALLTASQLGPPSSFLSTDIEPLLLQRCSTRMLLRLSLACAALLMMVALGPLTRNIFVGNRIHHTEHLRASTTTPAMQPALTTRHHPQASRRDASVSPVAATTKVVSPNATRGALHRAMPSQPPPSAPFPPQPPYPHSPPVKLREEPSLQTTCKHAIMPVDTSGRVRYPGGKWQYFAEWSGLDEQAAEESRGSYRSYYDSDDSSTNEYMSYDGFSDDGRLPRRPKDKLRAAIAQADTARKSEEAERAKEDAVARQKREAALRAAAVTRLQLDPQPFLLNSDFSIAYGLSRSRVWPFRATSRTAHRRMSEDPWYGVEEDSHSPSHTLRLRLMMATYRGARTLGVLENKLLAASAMRRLGLPTMEVSAGLPGADGWSVALSRDIPCMPGTCCPHLTPQSPLLPRLRTARLHTRRSETGRRTPAQASMLR